MPYAAACAHLGKADPKLGKLIERAGVCEMEPGMRTEDVFEYLTRAIVFQQISGRAGAAIYRK